PATKKAPKSVGAQANAEKKGQKSAKAEPEAALAADQNSEDLEELEDQQEEAAARARSGGNAAALAATGGSTSTEMSASFKNFRHHPDMENFYRFIYENDLRHEALHIIDLIMAQKQHRKMLRAA